MIHNLMFIVLILAIIAFLTTSIGGIVIDRFNFFVEGQKYNLSVSELRLLWKVARASNFKHRSRLFWSVQALQEAIVALTNKIELSIDNSEKEKLTNLLSKLYALRTKVELEATQKRRGVQSTKQIAVGQVCVLVFPSFGQFYATIIENNSSGLKLRSIGEIPKAFNFRFTGDVSIYFWRKGDAGYLSKTKITNIEQSNSGTVFSATHSREIIRTQKRKSIRAKANFSALLFPQHPEIPANTIPEIINGVKCQVKDISEDGALVFVKGRCVRGMRAKLQFKLDKHQVVMFVRAIRFTYSTSQNISRIHFQCEKISEESRNAILSYVYEIKANDHQNKPEPSTNTETTQNS